MPGAATRAVPSGASGGAGAAAAKLGLFAKLGKLLAKGGKLIIIGLVALGAWLKRLFTGRRKEEEPTGLA